MPWSIRSRIIVFSGATSALLLTATAVWRPPAVAVVLGGTALSMVLAGLACGWITASLDRLRRGIRHIMATRDSTDPVPRPGAEEVPPRSEIVHALTVEFDALLDELETRRRVTTAIIDASPLGYFRTDAQGRTVSVNEAYRRITGLAPGSTQHWDDLLVPQEQAGVRVAWQHAVSQRIAYRALQHIEHGREREVRAITVSSWPVMLGRTFRGFVGAIEDVTARESAESERRHLLEIFEASSDFFAQLDAHGNLIYLNPAGRRRAGLGAAAPLAGHSYADFHPPETMRRLAEEILPHAVRHGMWLGETTMLGGGTPFAASEMIIAHQADGGRIERFSAVIRDVSADKANADAVARSEATLRALADAIPGLVAYIDRDEVYRFVNLSYERGFGVGRGEVIGKTLHAFLGDTEYRDIAMYVRLALQGERVVFERARMRNGAKHYVESTYLPQRDGSGSVIGFHAVLSDITERKREEERLLRASLTDHLTGLLNRAGFESAAEEAIRAARGRGNALALLFVDLDHFKAVNDTHGHAAGDLVLKVFGERLCAVLRAGDEAARFGGDEFAAILEGMRAEQDALLFAAKVVEAAQKPFALPEGEARLGASVGVAVLRGDDDLASLLRRADDNLYRAKAAGRGRASAGDMPQAAAR